MTCNLLVLLAIQTAIPNIKGTILLAQVVITLTIGGPHRCAVFAGKVGKLGVFTFRQHPDVAADCRLVVLAIHILAALDVVIQHIARFAVDIDIGHHQSGEQAWTTALYAHLVNLRKLPKAGDDALACGHVGHAEQHVVVVGKRQHVLKMTTGGNLLWLSALAGHHPYVDTPLTVGSKSNLAAVGAPNWVVVVSRVGGKLLGCTTCNRHCKQIALVRKSNRLSVGRNGTETHPERTLLGDGHE